MENEVYGAAWMEDRRRITVYLLTQDEEYRQLYHKSPAFRIGLEMLVEQLPMFVAGIARQATAEGDRYEREVTALKNWGRPGLFQTPRGIGGEGESAGSSGLPPED